LKTGIDGWVAGRQAREAHQATPETPEKKAVHPVTKERYDRLHDNADKLMKNCTLLKMSAEELEANVRRIEESRAKWRASKTADGVVAG